MLVAVLMMLAVPEQASADCASATPRGPDFMAMISGGSKPRPTARQQDRMGGTIVDPPARHEPIMPGTLAANGTSIDFPSDRPAVDSKADAEQTARNEAAGICNAGKHAG
jgi:hypothetical protein